MEAGVAQNPARGSWMMPGTVNEDVEEGAKKASRRRTGALICEVRGEGERA